MRMTSGCVSIAVATPCSPSVASMSRYVVRDEKLADDLPVELVVLDVEHGLLTHATLPSGSRTGTAKKNVDPSPGVLSTQMRPPCSSTNFLVMLSPRPVPPYSRLMVGVHLPELREDVFRLVLGDADPGVGHAVDERVATPLCRRSPRAPPS